MRESECSWSQLRKALAHFLRAFRLWFYSKAAYSSSLHMWPAFQGCGHGSSYLLCSVGRSPVACPPRLARLYYKRKVLSSFTNGVSQRKCGIRMTGLRSHCKIKVSKHW